MSEKFTPGPWEADATHCRTAINTANGVKKHIAMVNIAKNPEYEITIEEHEANARLIAAAPEMLDILRWLDARLSTVKEGVVGVLFTRDDIELVKYVVKQAMEG